jgi:predicted amidohydrolase
MPTIKVAAVQFAPVFEDKMGNLRKMAFLVKQAAEEGAQLIVLPELATTGYSFMSKAQALPFAEPIHPDTLTFKSMRVLAETFRAYIAWGMVELEAGTGDLFNSQVIVSPDGTWASYRKVNRWGNDYLWARPGRANPPIIKAFFDAPKGEGLVEKKIGLLVCRDVRDKKDDKWKSFYEKGDADIVCLSANWGDGGFPSISWLDFAEDNNAHLIVSNRYGKESCNDFGEGGSCIISPPDKVHCEGLKWDAECIVYADLEA